MKHIYVLFLSACFLNGCASLPSPTSTSAENTYNQLLETSSPQLREFLREMPKGGDLHNHLSGAIYAENYIAWGQEAGLCVNTKTFVLFAPGSTPKGCQAPESMKISDYTKDSTNYASLIDSLSMRGFTPDASAGNRSGHDHFFATFAKFNAAGNNRAGDMLAETMRRAKQQNILYLELMTSPGMDGVRKLGASWGKPLTQKNFSQLYDYLTITHRAELDALVINARMQLDTAEKEAAYSLPCRDTDFHQCPVNVRYLAQVIRVFPPEQVFAQSVLAYELMKADPRVVGLNFVAPEDDVVTLRDYAIQMTMLHYLSLHYKDSPHAIALHAGELTLGLVPPEQLQSHISQAVNAAGAKRIGHGVDIFYEKNATALLKKMAKNHVMVEINLTSNDTILGVKGKDHPLLGYMQHHVPVSLSTDDEGVSRIDLTHEYQRAATDYQLTYPQLKMFSRNSLEYAFLPGKSLWKKGAGTTPDSFVVRHRECQDVSSSACEAVVAPSEKASLQRELELKFLAFEEKITH